MKKSTILVGFAAFVGFAIAGTFALPNTVTVERKSVVALAPDAVLTLAASNQGYQQFNPYKTTDPNLKLDMFGPVSGVGSGFKFDGKEGQGSQTVVGVSPERIDLQIDMGPIGRPTQAIAATAHPKGSEVTWTMTMELGNNPMMRVMGLAMDGMMGPTLDTGLSNLNNLGKPA